jgi:phosphoglycolate phosphatase
MSYKAVIFDLDGTLLDTLADIADATNHALRSLGFPEHPCESFRYFFGDGVETLIQRVLPVD